MWRGNEMNWGRVLLIAVLAAVAGGIVWALIESVFEPPGFVSLIFVTVVTVIVGRTLLPLAAKRRGGEERG